MRHIVAIEKTVWGREILINQNTISLNLWLREQNQAARI
jgi:hypothetical protein